MKPQDLEQSYNGYFTSEQQFGEKWIWWFNLTDCAWITGPNNDLALISGQVPISEPNIMLCWIQAGKIAHGFLEALNETIKLLAYYTIITTIGFHPKKMTLKIYICNV